MMVADSDVAGVADRRTVQGRARKPKRSIVRPTQHLCRELHASFSTIDRQAHRGGDPVFFPPGGGKTRRYEWLVSPHIAI